MQKSRMHIEVVYNILLKISFYNKIIFFFKEKTKLIFMMRIIKFTVKFKLIF